MEVIFLSPFTKHLTIFMTSHNSRVCRGRDRMVFGFITTYVISAYHH